MELKYIKVFILKPFMYKIVHIKKKYNNNIKGFKGDLFHLSPPIIIMPLNQGSEWRWHHIPPSGKIKTILHYN